MMSEWWWHLVVGNVCQSWLLKWTWDVIGGEDSMNNLKRNDVTKKNLDEQSSWVYKWLQHAKKDTRECWSWEELDWHFAGVVVGTRLVITPHNIITRIQWLLDQSEGGTKRKWLLACSGVVQSKGNSIRTWWYDQTWNNWDDDLVGRKSWWSTWSFLGLGQESN